jgi:hypothetical protein
MNALFKCTKHEQRTPINGLIKQQKFRYFSYEIRAETKLYRQSKNYSK